MQVNPLFQNFEKCTNYTVIGTLVANTISSMRRFKDIPRDEMISKVYRTVKSRAQQVASSDK